MPTQRSRQTPRLAFNADPPLLSEAPLPLGPDEIHLGVLSEAVASQISQKPVFIPSGNTAQASKILWAGSCFEQQLGEHISKEYSMYLFLKEVLYRTHSTAENLENTHTEK